jgi:hypothetical protein
VDSGEYMRGLCRHCGSLVLIGVFYSQRRVSFFSLLNLRNELIIQHSRIRQSSISSSDETSSSLVLWFLLCLGTIDLLPSTREQGRFFTSRSKR